MMSRDVCDVAVSSHMKNPLRENISIHLDTSSLYTVN
jgi:hypothetical protein